MGKAYLLAVKSYLGSYQPLSPTLLDRGTELFLGLEAFVALLLPSNFLCPEMSQGRLREGTDVPKVIPQARGRAGTRSQVSRPPALSAPHSNALPAALRPREREIIPVTSVWSLPSIRHWAQWLHNFSKKLVTHFILKTSL